ncbi:DUF3419 family protein [Pseudaestuariivita rosea]|uniref:DUF3419 family protein n=1 Tax=Pseudaestuariivita rosea TaxID=2763263 RepID=UPI001ABBD3A4|nr:DUF3419 family protein [Pseudaestuariivita rosea]
MQVKQTIDTQLSEAVHQNTALTKAGLSERMFSQLFKGLVYPQIWEDPEVDMQALQISDDCNLVCIASGGCNLMSYLTASPHSITAVDLSPAHVALNRLKLTAARVLEYDDFYQFFGHADRQTNVAIFDQKIAPELDTSSLSYWMGRRGLAGRRIDLFARGFYRYGVLGRFIGLAHFVAKLGRVDFKPFLRCQNLEEQKEFFETRIAPLFDKKLVQFLARRKASLFGLGIPPQQYDKLAADGGGDITVVLKERVRKLMCDFSVSENYFAWQAFNRAYNSTGNGPVPPYLQSDNFAALKENADRAQIYNRSLTDLLTEHQARTRHGYVLLDAQDWMTDEQLTALWGQITRTASDGARVIFRTGGTDDILPGRVPETILSQWSRDPVSDDLFELDRSAIYGGFHKYVFRG